MNEFRDPKIEMAILKKDLDRQPQIAHEPERPEAPRNIDTAARLGLVVLGGIVAVDLVAQGLTFFHNCMTEAILADTTYGISIGLKTCAIEHFTWLQYLGHMLQK
jgi:hypothetical protein